jgi:hypothetical protein
MTRPVNVFGTVVNYLKDLIVTVKIGCAKVSPFGVILAQISDTKFKVQDDLGNEGICTLVNKRNSEDLEEDEMTIKGLVTNNVSFVLISKVIKDIMFDFKNIRYHFTIDHDSTSNILLLTERG